MIVIKSNDKNNTLYFKVPSRTLKVTVQKDNISKVGYRGFQCLQLGHELLERMTERGATEGGEYVTNTI